MSFPFGLKNWQVCQQWILSVFNWKCLFRLHFWWTVLLHIEFWVDSFLQSIFCHSTPFWFPLSPVTGLRLLYDCSLIREESFFSCCFQDFLFLWLATVWLCTGMERSVFMLLEVCWDSWMSFSNTFLAIISLNGFFVCVLPQPCLQPWANRATVPPHSPVFKTVTSINKATGRAAAHHSKPSEPLLTLAEKLLVLTTFPSQAKPCYQQSSKRSWEEPQAKSHRFPLFSPKFSSFFSTNTSQIVVCLWCISRVLK